jgi:hypothetical protein
MKMAVIGLGKHAQASAIHSLGVRGLREVMPAAAREVLRCGNVMLGLAVVENAYDETMCVEAIPADEIVDREPALLDMAKANMPRLPVSDIDVLIVEEMGKNISGLGMDPNIIGRLKIPGQPEPHSPKIKVIFVRDLTEDSHGNAIGMGLADIASRRFFEKIDFKATYANVVTSTFLERGKVPLIVENDREAMAIACRACGVNDPQAVRVVRIKNTLRLDVLHVSPPVLREIESRDEIDVGDRIDRPIGDDGHLAAFNAD